MKLNVKSLTTGLTFHGEVHGKRQHYYVLSSARQYFVMSISNSKRDAGNFNLVGKAAVDRLYRRLRGRRGLTLGSSTLARETDALCTRIWGR